MPYTPVAQRNKTTTSGYVPVPLRPKKETPPPPPEEEKVTVVRPDNSNVKIEVAPHSSVSQTVVPPVPKSMIYPANFVGPLPPGAQVEQKMTVVDADPQAEITGVVGAYGTPAPQPPKYTGKGMVFSVGAGLNKDQRQVAEQTIQNQVDQAKKEKELKENITGKKSTADDFIKGAVRALPRAVISTANTIVGPENVAKLDQKFGMRNAAIKTPYGVEYVAMTPLSRFIFGDEPIGDVAQEGQKFGEVGAAAAIALEEKMDKVKLDEGQKQAILDDVKKYKWLTIPLGILSVGSDLVPGVGGAKKELSKEAAERLIKKYGMEAANEILEKGGKDLAEQALKQETETFLKKVPLDNVLRESDNIGYESNQLSRAIAEGSNSGTNGQSRSFRDTTGELVSEAKQKGFVDIRGEKAKSPEEVAALLKDYRNPKQEVFHVVYADKKGKVVGHTALTSKEIDVVAIPQKELYYKIGNRADRLKADKIYIAHNHPSGFPGPSDADEAFTKNIAQRFNERFGGSIVLDHDQMAVIQPGAKGVTTEIKDIDLGRSYRSTKVAITSPTELASFAETHWQPQRGKMGIFVVNTQNHPVGYKEINFGPEKFERLNNAIQQVVKENDGKQAFLALTHKDLEDYRVYVTEQGGKRLNALDIVVQTPTGGMLPLGPGREVFTEIPQGLTGPEILKKTTRLFEQETKYNGNLPRLPKLPKLVDGVQPPKVTAKKIKEAINPPSKKVVRTESALLRQRIKDEARGARYGARAGREEARIAITNRLRNKFEIEKGEIKREGELKLLKQNIINRDADRVRSGIVDYVKSNLPVADRGKFIRMVTNAETQRDLVKAFVRVDREVDTIAKKTLLNELKSKVRSLSDSGGIAVDYVQKIKDLTAGIDFVGRKKSTLERLQKIERYIEQQKALGKDVELPTRIFESLKILARKPAKEMKVAELQNLYDQIELLEKLGRTKQATRVRLYEAEKAQKLANLLDTDEGIVAIEKNPLLEAKPGEKLPLNKKLKNVFPKLLNGAQRVDLSLTPVDVFFDLLDGGNGTYTGSAYRVFKQTTDTNYQKFLEQFDELSSGARLKAEKLKLDEQNFERVGIHAARVQKDGVEKLVNSGLTEQEIQAIKLTDAEMEFYDYMRGELDKLREPIAEVMRTVYNKDLGKVENYFSFMTDWDAMSETEVFQRFGQEVPEYSGRPTKQVEKGFTEKRTGAGTQKIKLNAMEIFLKHTENATYLVNMARDNKMLFEIANSPSFGKAAGDLGQRMTLEWIDLISRKGGVEQAKKLPVLDWLRKNVGIARLGFKLSSAIIQPTALMDGAAQIGTWAFRGLGDVVSDGKIRKFVWENMPEIKARVGDDPAFLEQASFEWFKKAQDAGYWAIKKLDGVAASSVAWGAYRKKLKDLGEVLDLAKPNAEALEYAQKMVRRSQSSGLFKDVPLALSRGNLTGNRSFDKALLQFQSFVLNRWSNIRHDMWRAGIRGGVRANVKNRDFRKAAGIAFWLSIAVLAEEGIRRASQELVGLATGEEVEHDDGYTEAVAKNVIGTIPFMGTAMGSAAYDSNPIPALGFFDSASNAYRTKDVTKKLIYLSETAGLFSGVPGTTQSSQLLRGWTEEEKEEKTTTKGGGMPKLPKLPKLPKVPSLP